MNEGGGGDNIIISVEAPHPNGRKGLPQENS
jgi:hypothetical protein